MGFAQTSLADFIHRARRHARDLTLAAARARRVLFFRTDRRLDIRENFFVMHLRFYAVPLVRFSGRFKRQRRGGGLVDSLSLSGIIEGPGKVYSDGIRNNVRASWSKSKGGNGGLGIFARLHSRYRSSY